MPSLSLLCVIAHPDDETLCMGGTLLKYARRGVDITILSITRGEGGDCGDPPVCQPGELGRVREQELRRAAAILGVRDVVFLGYVDPPPGPGNTLRPATTDVMELVEKLVTFIRMLQPTVVVTHGTNGEYGHPQHIVTNKAVTMAFDMAGNPWQYGELGFPAHQPSRLYYFAAAAPPGGYFSHFRNASDPPTLVVNVAAYLPEKHQAFRAHASQIHVTLRDAAQFGKVDPFNLFPNTESFFRAYPPPAPPLEEDMFEDYLGIV